MNPVRVTLHVTKLAVRSIRLPGLDTFHQFLHRGWSATDRRRFLFRADRELHASKRYNVVSMLVTAPDPPDWSRITREEPGVFVELQERFATWDLREGDAFCFKVRGHTATQRLRPDVREAMDREDRRAPRGAPTYTHVARTHADRVAWLRERFKGSGCELLRTPEGETEAEPIVSNTVDSVVIKTQARKGGERIVVHGADFDGCLVVTDPVRFADVLRSGLSGCDRRHLGCGLLSIRRVATFG